MKCNYLSKDIQKRRFFGMLWDALVFLHPERDPSFHQKSREKDFPPKERERESSYRKTLLLLSNTHKDTGTKRWKLMATSSTSSLNTTSSATSSGTASNGQRRYARSSTSSVAQLLSDSCNSILQRFRRNPSENKLSASSVSSTSTGTGSKSVATEKRPTNNLR